MNLQPTGALKFWHTANNHTMELYKFNLSYSLHSFWIPFSWMDCSFSTACLHENSSHRCFSAILEREGIRLLSTWRKLQASLVCARTSLLSTDIDLSAVLTTPADSLSVRRCSQLESFASGLKFASPRLLIDKFHRRGLIFFEFFEGRSCASCLDRTNKVLDVCTKSYTCPLPRRIVVYVPCTAEYRQHHQSVWQLLSF